jgi:hypothetical protein
LIATPSHSGDDPITNIKLKNMRIYLNEVVNPYYEKLMKERRFIWSIIDDDYVANSISISDIKILDDS